MWTNILQELYLYPHTPIHHWMKYRGMEEKLMKSRSNTFRTVGQFLANTSEDLNSSVCDYITQSIWTCPETLTTRTIAERRKFGLIVWCDWGHCDPQKIDLALNLIIEGSLNFSSIRIFLVVRLWSLTLTILRKFPSTSILLKDFLMKLDLIKCFFLQVFMG